MKRHKGDPRQSPASKLSQVSQRTLDEDEEEEEDFLPRKLPKIKKGKEVQKDVPEATKSPAVAPGTPNTQLKPALNAGGGGGGEGGDVTPAEVFSALRLRRIVRESHGRSINQITFSPEPQNRNLVATVGDNQVLGSNLFWKRKNGLPD